MQHTASVIRSSRGLLFLAAVALAGCGPMPGFGGISVGGPGEGYGYGGNPGYGAAYPGYGSPMMGLGTMFGNTGWGDNAGWGGEGGGGDD